MLLVPPEHVAGLRDWFRPERPGPLVGMHVVNTGHGTCVADRWPDPRALLVSTAGNHSLAGDPHALDPADLARHVTGFLDAPESFDPLLRAAFPDAVVWDRVMLDRRVPACPGPVPGVRPLGPADTDHLAGLDPESTWISDTWGGPAGLAASGLAHGAFVDGRLASVACTFYVGERYEEIGVATEPDHRGRGLSAASAAALCADIRARARCPSWTTSPDNVASLRVAEKLGFVRHHEDRLHLCGVPVPQVPVTPAG